MTIKNKTVLFSSLALTLLIVTGISFQVYRTTNSRLYQTVSKLERVNHAGHEIAIAILLDLTNADSLRENLKDIAAITKQLQEILPTATKPVELINLEMSFVRLTRVFEDLSPGQPIEKALLAQVRYEAMQISDNVAALKNLSERETNKLQARVEMMITAFFILLVAYIVGVFWLLFGMVITPLRSFSSQVEKIREGHLENVLLSPRTDELGLLAKAFNQLIDKRRVAETALKEEITLHKQALDKVKLLSGFLPICASCKQIRDDRGYWNQIETYIRDNSEVEFTHSICPDCANKLYGNFLKK